MYYIIILFLIGAVALMQCLLFHSGVLAIIAVVLCLAGIVLNVLRHFPKTAFIKSKALNAVISLLIIALSCGCLVFAERNTAAVSDYDKAISEIEKDLQDGNDGDAAEALDELEEEYGADEQTVALRVMLDLAKDDFESAYSDVDRLADHTSVAYYTLKENICVADGSDEANEIIAGLYDEASAKYPAWTHMQKMEGIVRITNGDYDGAEYFLSKALMQDTEDGDVYYYLAVTAYHQGEYDAMNSYFDEAVKYDLSENKTASIDTYKTAAEKYVTDDTAGSNSGDSGWED